MKMRKWIALVLAVMMLFSIIPVGAVSVSAAPDDVIVNTNFDDGELNGWDSASDISVEDGVLVFNVTKDFGHIYNFLILEANTDYEISFMAKASLKKSLWVKFNKDWTADVARADVNLTTDWAEYTVTLNSGDNTSLVILFQYSVFATDGQIIWLDNIVVTKASAEPDAPADGNLIVNGGFEDGKNGWQFNSGTAEIVTDAHSGSKALSLTNPGQWSSAAIQTIAVEANTDYVLTWYAKRVSGSGPFNLYVMNAVGYASVERLAGQNWVNDKATNWIKYEYTINTGDATSLLLKWSTEAMNPGTILIDDFSIAKVGVAEPDVPVEPDDGNLIVNGDFETGDASGWKIGQSTTISADAAKDGAYGAHLVGNGGWGGMLNQTMTVVPGKQYKLSFWINVNAMGVNVQVKNGVGAALEGAGGWFDSTTKDKLVEWTFTATDSSVVLNFCGSGTGSAEDVYVDNFSLVYIPPCEHSYVAVVTAPDCVNGGYTVYTCSVCGDSYVANYTAALGHAAGAAADCTNPQVCTVCGKVLNAALGHAYDNVCDSVCNVCEAVRVAPHTYVNACDRDCNLCGVTRIAPHAYDGDCDSACNLCSFKRQSTADHVYTDDCDATCNVCGDIRTDLGHVYTDSCDYDCNHCGALREPPHHYGEKYDPTCDVCGTWREIVIVYGDANGDDFVNVRDITLLQQYLAGWDVTPDVVAADANGDGSVTIRDITLLQQYLAGWGTTLG